MCARLEEVGELAQRVLANDVAIVDELEVADLRDRDVEVIARELDHTLIQLTPGERRTVNRGLLELRLPLPRHRLARRGELCGRLGEKRIAGRDDGFGRAVVDAFVKHLVLQPSLISKTQNVRRVR